MQTRNTKPELKYAEASANNALGSYGKAFVNMSFRGNIQNPEPIIHEIKELSDEEFEEYKARLDEKIQLLPNDVQEIMSKINITKTNILLADKILSDENLYGNEYLLEYLEESLNNTDSLEKESYKMELIDLFTSDDKLRNDDVIKSAIGLNISMANSSEFVDVKRKVKEEIYNTFDKDSFVMENIGNSMCATDTLKQYELFHKIIHSNECKKKRMPYE